MSYAREQLYLALHTLVAAAPIRDRLAGAARAMIMLEPKDFHHADEAQSFARLWHELTHVKGERAIESDIDASVKGLTDEHAVRLARAVLSLYHGLDQSGPYPTPEFPTVA